MRIYVIALIEGQGGLRVKRRDDTIVIRVLVVWPPPPGEGEYVVLAPPLGHLQTLILGAGGLVHTKLI